MEKEHYVQTRRGSGIPLATECCSSAYLLLRVDLLILSGTDGRSRGLQEQGE